MAFKLLKDLLTSTSIASETVLGNEILLYYKYIKYSF